MKRMNRKYAVSVFKEAMREHYQDAGFMLFGYEVPIYNLVLLLEETAPVDFMAICDHWADSKDILIVDEPEDLDG